ncbi:MAG: NTP transferase domain-containing protein [Sphingomicrobium sp.]
MKWTAVLLAGSRPGGDPLARSMMVGHKALLPVAGEPMLLRPLRALLASPAIGEVIVLTQEPRDLRPVLPGDPRVSLRASRETIASSIAELISDRAAQFPVLVTTADHALLDEAMIAEFTRAATGADLAIGLVEREPLMRRFPDAKRTWIGFRGGSYSGANLFAFGSAKVLPAIERWRSVEQDRKKGWRILAALGPALLLGAVLKLRTLHQTAAAVGRKLGIDIRMVEMSNPLAAIDVDKVEDHELVEAIIAGKA